VLVVFLKKKKNANHEIYINYYLPKDFVIFTKQ